MTTILMLERAEMTVAGGIAAFVVAASLIDLSFGLLATLAHDALGAIRRLGKGSKA